MIYDTEEVEKHIEGIISLLVQFKESNGISKEEILREYSVSDVSQITLERLYENEKIGCYFSILKMFTIWEGDSRTSLCDVLENYLGKLNLENVFENRRIALIEPVICDNDSCNND